ncbi:MAG: hypothetical protein Q8Q52_06490, partial [Acidimicrobiia bacterium]|nr:hypothetical protein [Acidimicrobiia bacterium]
DRVQVSSHPSFGTAIVPHKRNKRNTRKTDPSILTRAVLVLETALAATADLFIRTVRLQQLPADQRVELGTRVAELVLRDQQVE